MTITPTSAPVRSRSCLPEPSRRGVRVEREKDDGLGLRRVRGVDAGRAADVAVAGAGDDQRRADSHELDRLVEDDLDPARVRFVARELARLLRRLDVRERDDLALDLRDGLLRHDDHVPVRQLCPLGDECSKVVSLPQLRQSLDRRDGEPRPDILDEDQRRVVVTPEAVQLLERDEADRLVEGTGRVVATVRARGAERLHLEVADALRPAPPLGLANERAPDAATMLLPPHAHDVDLGRPRRVLLQAEEAEVRLYGERRKRRGVLDVLAGGLLDPEPPGQVAEHRLGDARPLRRVGDLDDLRHGRPVTRMPAWPL